MKPRIFAIATAAAIAGCASPAVKEEPPRKPGFWERAWVSTQKGTGRIWDGTKSTASKGWESTKDLAASPFSKKTKTSAKAGIHQVEASVHLKPETIKLSSSRSFEATVQLTNKAARAVQFNFPSSQHVEALVKTEDGKIIQRWSDDQRIDHEASFVSVNPGERLEYVLTLSARNMVAGKTYVVEATVPGYGTIVARKIVVPQN
jgi:hypothetical protein